MHIRKLRGIRTSLYNNQKLDYETKTEAIKLVQNQISELRTENQPIIYYMNQFNIKKNIILSLKREVAEKTEEELINEAINLLDKFQKEGPVIKIAYKIIGEELNRRRSK